MPRGKVWVYRLLSVCLFVCLFVCTDADFTAEEKSQRRRMLHGGSSVHSRMRAPTDSRARRFVRLWASGGTKFTKCVISCLGRRWTAVQNLTPLALSSAVKSASVQRNKQTHITVNDISTPCPAACVDKDRRNLLKLEVSHGQGMKTARNVAHIVSANVRGDSNVWKLAQSERQWWCVDMSMSERHAKRSVTSPLTCHVGYSGHSHRLLMLICLVVGGGQ